MYEQSEAGNDKSGEHSPTKCPIQYIEHKDTVFVFLGNVV